MSRANIVSQQIAPDGYYVEFALRDGGRVRYRYSLADGVSIASGSDPKEFDGERTAGPAMGGSGIEGVEGIADAAVDIGEIGLM